MKTITIKNEKTAIIILCTLPNNQKLAIKLIKILLNAKLAACITLLNAAHSFYYWDNKFESNIEIQLLIKTKKSLEKLVFNKINEFHPYQIPELLTIPIISVESNYLQWMYSELQK